MRVGEGWVGEEACLSVEEPGRPGSWAGTAFDVCLLGVPSAATTRERPSSAIYPSDSFRQSLLGSRRGRSSLSLAKSVSTTNIAG